jgi:hypothetical protein
VLLLPVVLFLLGLPNKPPGVRATGTVVVQQTELAVGLTTLVALAPDPRQPFVPLVVLYSTGPTGPVRTQNLKQLVDAPYSDPSLAGAWVRVRGQFAPYSDHQFVLARQRRYCCAGDSVQLSVPVVCRDKLRDASGNWVVAGNANVRKNDWVEVIGRVQFYRQGTSTIPMLEVLNVRNITATSPDLDPYLN